MHLTRREHAVLALIARGHTDREIAGQLAFSLSSARKHRENLLAKFQAGKSTQLVVHYLALDGAALKKTL